MILLLYEILLQSYFQIENERFHWVHVHQIVILFGVLFFKSKNSFGEILLDSLFLW